MKALRVIFIVSLLALPLGCKSRSGLREPVLTPEGALNFAIRQAGAAAGSTQLWDCSYSSSGKTAKFRLEFDAAHSRTESDSAPMTFGKGAFLAVPGSDASSLIQDLQKPLQANGIPPSLHRVPELAFTYAHYGDHMSQAVSGGFAEDPPGDWSVYKLFVGTTKDGEPAEIFLNVDAPAGVGQFARKDPQYGETLLSYLSSVL